METREESKLVQDAKDIAAELPSLPSPPSDLPRPWKSEIQVRIFLIAFIASIFLLWWIGGLLNKPYLGTFDGSCTTNIVIFMFLGIYILIRFYRRGYNTHYGFLANRPLFRAYRRYRRKNLDEVPFDLYVQYLVDDRDVYLIWYLPHGADRGAKHLMPGSEPLLFTREGQWIDDEDLFHKVMLMWGHALDLCPGTLERQITKDYRDLRRISERNIPVLPSLLEQFETELLAIGMQDQLHIVRETFPAKYALLLNTIDVIGKKIEWAEAHGWDSMTQLRYADMLAYHEAYVASTESRLKFIETHKIEEAQKAATTMSEAIVANRSQFPGLTQVDLLARALLVFAAPLATAEIIHHKENGSWRAPSSMLDAYHSRLAYAREVDQKLQEKAAKKKER